MQNTSTIDYRYRALAVLTAGCLASTFPVNAEVSSSAWTGADLHRYAYGSLLDFQDIASDGHVRIYYDVGDAAVPQVLAPRETTEQERLIALLRSFDSFKANWDGESAQAPVHSSLKAAGEFVCLLNSGIEMPEPLLHASGRAGLAWSGDASYGELEFLENGSVAYYFADGKGKHKGVVEFDGLVIPAALGVLLPAA